MCMCIYHKWIVPSMEGNKVTLMASSSVAHMAQAQRTCYDIWPPPFGWRKPTEVEFSELDY